MMPRTSTLPTASNSPRGRKREPRRERFTFRSESERSQIAATSVWPPATTDGASLHGERSMTTSGQVIAERRARRGTPPVPHDPAARWDVLG
jgi:hypothetical protein